jgi:flagellar basal-body rod modification protein FlgD
VSSGLLALAGSSSAASGSATDDHDMFLQLLVAQLRYQDPMNPTDSTEFLSQNAQFTALQKMQDVADGLSQLVSVQMSFGAAGMIGRQVTWVDDDGATRSGVATGVSFPSTGPILTVNGSDVAVASVTAVSTPTTTSTSGDTSTDTSTDPTADSSTDSTTGADPTTGSTTA